MEEEILDLYDDCFNKLNKIIIRRVDKISFVKIDTFKFLYNKYVVQMT